jgi:hypothetical protein
MHTQYTTSDYKVSLMQSIEFTGKSKKCLILDSKLLAKEHESASYNCEAEKLLGEAKENLSKVMSTITTSTAISNMHHLHAYIVNICTIIKAQFVCNLPLKDIHTPSCSL